jgi:hypothetical protein
MATLGADPLLIGRKREETALNIRRKSSRAELQTFSPSPVRTTEFMLQD